MDIQKNVEISIYLEGFPGVAILIVPPTSTDSFSVRLKLSDTSGRKLTLNAHVSIKSTDTIKVCIFVIHFTWFYNIVLTLKYVMTIIIIL